MSLRAEAERLLDLGLLPIPGAEKAPSGIRHKGGLWTREIARREIRRFEKAPTLCILTDSTPNIPNIITNLFVLDFDDEVSFEWMRAKFPIIDTSPLVKTSHGYHVYFQRSILCEDFNLTDGARALKATDYDEGLPRDGKGKLLIDIKTRTSVMNPDGSYTASVLSVPPSKNKIWVRAFPETPLIQVPDQLVDWLHARRVTGKRRAAIVAMAEDSQASASKRLASIRMSERIEPNVSCLRELGFMSPVQTLVFDTVSDSAQKHGYCAGAQFVDPLVQNGAACPLCRKPDGHASNQYSMLIKGDGSRFVKNLSGSCVDRYVQLPWDEAAITAHRNAWLNAETVGCSPMIRFRDFDAYMAADRETAVLVRGESVYSIDRGVATGWHSRTPWVARSRKHFMPSSDILAMFL
jgi:hypothetical protein